MDKYMENIGLRAEIERLKSQGKDLLVERNSLAYVLKSFVDGERDQDESQAERHMYHDEAEALLAYLGGEAQGHTLVPDEILRIQRQIKDDLINANNQKAAMLLEQGVKLFDLGRLQAFANEMINASFEGGGFDGGDIQGIAVKHGLLRIERREDECGEGCACRGYGFPAECYRKTSLLAQEDTHGH